METSFTAVIPIKQFDPENLSFQKKGHKVAIIATEEGVRIRLISPNTNEENQADIYLEARPDGWHAMAHPNHDEEPAARLIIPNDGNTVKTLQEA